MSSFSIVKEKKAKVNQKRLKFCVISFIQSFGSSFSINNNQRTIKNVQPLVKRIYWFVQNWFEQTNSAYYNNFSKIIKKLCSIKMEYDRDKTKVVVNDANLQKIEYLQYQKQIMKAQKYFILVSENLKSTIYKTEKAVQNNLEKNPFQKKFTFDNQQDALNFHQQASNITKEQLQQLEFNYQIQYQLKQYEHKIMSCKSFKVNTEDELDGVQINLRKPTAIFVLWDKKCQPLIFFNQNTVKKFSTQSTEVRQFYQPADALTYIRGILEYEAKSTALGEQDEGEFKGSENTEKVAQFSNDEAVLFSLDNQYQYLLPKKYTEEMKSVKLDYSLQYAIQCSCFSTMHYHSSIGIALTNRISGEILKKIGIYTNKKKPNHLGLTSVFFGLRYAIYLKIPSLTLQIPGQQDFQYLTKMVLPQFPQQKQIIEAIDNYSALMKNIKYEQISRKDCEEAYRSAVSAFEKYAFITERSKKHRQI